MKKSFKKLAAAIAAFTMISAAAYGGSLSANAADQSATAWGDANLDKEVGLSDALLILQYLANSQKYPSSLRDW